MTDCVLHIGVEKTGTTSIQATLAANRERLLSRGILYPRSLGHRSHIRAYAYASEGPLDEIKVHGGLAGLDALESFRRTLSGQFNDEIASARPDKIFISNEHLSSRLKLPSEISRLKTLLAGHCRSTKVVVYLRAQGEAFQSAYSTYIKTGGVDAFQVPDPTTLRERYDYDALLQRWEGVFGRSAMDVRLYEPGELPGGDIFLDFADLFNGLISVSDLSIESKKNQSLDSFTLAFLRAINRYVPYELDARMSEMRGNLHDLVEIFASGPPFEGASEVIDAVDAAVQESNEAVRHRFFPTGPRPLFPRRPAQDRTISSSQPAIPDEAVRLMAFLWEAKQTQVLRLKHLLSQRAPAASPAAESKE